MSMNKLFLLPVLFATGCGFDLSGGVDATTSIGPGTVDSCQVAALTASADPSECIAKGQVPIYANRFSSSCGASSVVSGRDALASAADTSGSGSSSSASDTPASAMVVSCGAAQCPAGQVGVVGADPTNLGTPAGAVGCAEPPPSCPGGESPQYLFSSSTWECTGCDLVVTYGATYGNYSRCASTPTIECGSGEVPTWDLDSEQWGCKPTCDNGDYDQHSVDGSTVCVPC
jgi:hypothetical protein